MGNIFCQPCRKEAAMTRKGGGSTWVAALGEVRRGYKREGRQGKTDSKEKAGKIIWIALS